MYHGLLLDIGGVILDAWRALDAYATVTGVPVPGRGPIDPDGDPAWQEKLAGTLTLDGYWDRVARTTGHDNWRAMFRSITEHVPDALFDANAVALMRDARAAGRRVGVLSNDAYAIQSRAFFGARPEFKGLDAFVDASDIGVSKPEPDAYLVAAEALGVAAEGVVFLDDAAENVDGARAVGMFGIQVDPGNATPAFDEARELLGLAS
ncbi:MAG TPA: HAD-IA family hydrolase [Acidimicrobiales bacterium]|jgi:putative hydrolase of the HAD superfamily|nr:HAD-IA family hydrolase [Acidimicrobiales bacterium]